MPRLEPFGAITATARPGAAVGRIAHAFDEPRLFKAIDDARKGDRLDIQDVGKLDLAKARALRQLHQHLPLRARYAEPDRHPVEGLAHSVSGLADFEGKSFHLPRI